MRRLSMVDPSIFSSSSQHTCTTTPRGAEFGPGSQPIRVVSLGDYPAWETTYLGEADDNYGPHTFELPLRSVPGAIRTPIPGVEEGIQLAPSGLRDSPARRFSIVPILLPARRTNRSVVFSSQWNKRSARRTLNQVSEPKGHPNLLTSWHERNGFCTSWAQAFPPSLLRAQPHTGCLVRVQSLHCYLQVAGRNPGHGTLQSNFVSNMEARVKKALVAC